jgi:hypothetical protein
VIFINPPHSSSQGIHEIRQIKNRVGGFWCQPYFKGLEVDRESRRSSFFLDLGRMFGNVSQGVILQKVLLDLTELKSYLLTD